MNDWLALWLVWPEIVRAQGRFQNLAYPPMTMNGAQK